MSELRCIDSFKTIIFTSNQPAKPTDNAIRDFLIRLEELNRTINLASLTVTPDLTDPAKFTYKFVAKDGRQWTQKLILDPAGGEGRMTYNVPDMFKPTEVNANIALRNLSVLPMLGLGVTKVSCIWV